MEIFYKAKTQHEAELLSRIEDQMIEKFNKNYINTDIKKCESKDELISILVEWANFWYNERPITKFHSEVVEMKKGVCDIRIVAIYRQAERLGLSDYMPELTLN